MKRQILDTSIWIEWLRGDLSQSMLPAEDAFILMPAVVMMELFAGARTSKDDRILNHLITPFVLRQRILTPTQEDFKAAGKILAKLRLSSSRYSNDVLIALAARRVGAELWTLNAKDFRPICEALRVSLITPRT